MFHLPVELLTEIFFYLSPKEVVKMSTMSRESLDILDPYTKTGMWMWRKYRESLGFPNPNQINLTDFMFLKAYYTIGCNNCTKHPRIRKIYWEFDARKLCDKCLEKLTVRDYLIKDDLLRESIDDLFPYVEKLGYNKFYGETFYKLYLLEDICNITDPDYVSERRSTYYNLKDFLHKLMIVEKNNKKRDAKLKKQKIDNLIAGNFPKEDIGLIKELHAYKNAFFSKSNLTSKRAQTLLTNSITKELRIIKIKNETITKIEEDLQGLNYTNEEINKGLYFVEEKIESLTDEMSTSVFQRMMKNIINHLNTLRYKQDFKTHVLIYIHWRSIFTFQDIDIVSNPIFVIHYNTISNYYSENRLEAISKQILHNLQDRHIKEVKTKLYENCYEEFSNFLRTYGIIEEDILLANFENIKDLCEIDILNNNCNISMDVLTDVKNKILNEKALYLETLPEDTKRTTKFYCRCGYYSNKLANFSKIKEHIENFHCGFLVQFIKEKNNK